MSTTYIKSVLFDLDGTLIDTASDFVRIIAKMSADNGWQPPPPDAIRQQVSAGSRAMVRLMLEYSGIDLTTRSSDDQLETLRQRFLDTYEADICIDSQVFLGLDDYLRWLEAQGTPWGIVTNKPRYLAEQLLDKLDLTERCAVLVCPDDVQQSKPDPEPMYLAMEKLGLARGIAKSVIYVGDHKRDIDAGNRAGMITVLASYGYLPPIERDDVEAWQADYIAKTPAKLVDLLRSPRFEYL